MISMGPRSHYVGGVLDRVGAQREEEQEAAHRRPHECVATPRSRRATRVPASTAPRAVHRNERRGPFALRRQLPKCGNRCAGRAGWGSPIAGRSRGGNAVHAAMRALLLTILCLRAGTHARMATPCRAGTDHCRLVNTQKSIRAAADRAEKCGGGQGRRAHVASDVRRERSRRPRPDEPGQYAAARQGRASASLAKTKVSAARVERLAPSTGRDNLVDLALAAVDAADEATQAQVAAAAARAARASEGAQKSDAQRAWGSGDVRLIARMARAAEDALAAVVEETERRHRHETAVDQALEASEIVERQSRRAHRAAYEARMTAKHIAFGADDARGRMSAAADSAMTHAVEAAAGARGEASGRRGVSPGQGGHRADGYMYFNGTERLFVPRDVLCHKGRGREGIEIDKCDEEKGTCYPTGTSWGFMRRGSRPKP